MEIHHLSIRYQIFKRLRAEFEHLRILSPRGEISSVFEQGEDARLFVKFTKIEISLYRSGRAISSSRHQHHSSSHYEPSQVISLSNLVRASPSWKKEDIAYILSTPTLQILMESPALKFLRSNISPFAHTSPKVQRHKDKRVNMTNSN